MNIQIILASIRPNRVTERVAKWVNTEASNLEGVKVEIVDLKDYVLPLFDEPVSPQYSPQRQPEEIVKKWLDKLSQADAFIVVSPEYNRSVPGAMKNALDYIDFQIAKKPVALVTHGSVGGAFAVAEYRQALAQLLAISVPEATMIIGASNIFDESGQLDAKASANPYGPSGALARTLASLVWLGKALNSIPKD
jgi:NAD(P)H-dependent FMN reductase